MNTNTKVIKVLGIVGTVIGMGATLLSGWVDDKKMEAKIDECVDKKLAETKEDEEDEES